MGAVMRLRRCCEARERAIMEQHGLSLAEYGCLLAFPAAGPSDARWLASELRLSPSRISRIVDALVSSRLIARHQDPRDRRVAVLSLTARGRRLRQQVDEALMACEALIGGRLDAGEQARAREGLGLMLRALEPT